MGAKSPWGDMSGSKLWQPFQFSLAAGAKTDGSSPTIPIVSVQPTIPEYWQVSLSPTATGSILIYPGSGPGGFRVRLGAGGKVTFPANFSDLIVENISAVSVHVTCIAIRGYPAKLELDAGELA